MKKAILIILFISVSLAVAVLFYQYATVRPNTKIEPFGPLTIATGAFYAFLFFLFLFGAFMLIKEFEKLE